MILGLPSLDVDFGNNSVVDYGDAPDTYDLAGEASHGILEGLFMGAGVDAEVAAQSGAFADGDDNSDTDDEDGVTFTTDLVADTVASVDVEISASDVSKGVIQACRPPSLHGPWSNALARRSSTLKTFPSAPAPSRHSPPCPTVEF